MEPGPSGKSLTQETGFLMRYSCLTERFSMKRSAAKSRFVPASEISLAQRAALQRPYFHPIVLGPETREATHAR